METNDETDEGGIWWLDYLKTHKHAPELTAFSKRILKASILTHFYFFPALFCTRNHTRYIARQNTTVQLAINRFWICTAIISHMHIGKCLSKYHSTAMSNIFRYSFRLFFIIPAVVLRQLQQLAAMALSHTHNFCFISAYGKTISQMHMIALCIWLIYSIAANCIERIFSTRQSPFAIFECMPCDFHERQNNVCLGCSMFRVPLPPIFPLLAIFFLPAAAIRPSAHQPNTVQNRQNVAGCHARYEHRQSRVDSSACAQFVSNKPITTEKWYQPHQIPNNNNRKYDYTRVLGRLASVQQHIDSFNQRKACNESLAHATPIRCTFSICLARWPVPFGGGRIARDVVSIAAM